VSKLGKVDLFRREHEKERSLWRKYALGLNIDLCGKIVLKREKDQR
jgi:hypothetical protein